MCVNVGTHMLWHAFAIKRQPRVLVRVQTVVSVSSGTALMWVFIFYLVEWVSG